MDGDSVRIIKVAVAAGLLFSVILSGLWFLSASVSVPRDVALMAGFILSSLVGFSGVWFYKRFGGTLMPRSFLIVVVFSVVVLEVMFVVFTGVCVSSFGLLLTFALFWIMLNLFAANIGLYFVVGKGEWRAFWGGGRTTMWGVSALVFIVFIVVVVPWQLGFFKTSGLDSGAGISGFERIKPIDRCSKGEGNITIVFMNSGREPVVVESVSIGGRGGVLSGYPESSGWRPGDGLGSGGMFIASFEGLQGLGYSWSPPGVCYPRWSRYDVEVVVVYTENLTGERRVDDGRITGLCRKKSTAQEKFA